MASPPLGDIICSTVGRSRRVLAMRPLFVLVAWFLLLILWPLAWLLSLPFRVLGITFDALFALLRAILMLPARLLGHRSQGA